MGLSRKQMFSPAQRRGRLPSGPDRQIPAPDAPIRLQTDRAAEPVAVTVLIACRNGATTLGETLEGLAGQTWRRRWEILLVDNGSTDGSVALFEAWRKQHPELSARVVDGSARAGKPYALNVGISAAKGEAILFCDADDVPGKDWLATMGEALAAHDIVVSRMDYTRLNRGWVGEYRTSTQTDLEPLAYLPRFLHAGGGTMGVRKAVFDRAGGFDEGFLYLEDTEFCIRAQLAGFGLHLVPEAVMHIRSRDDHSRIFAQLYAWGRYEMKLVRKYQDEGVPRQGGWRRYLSEWRQTLRHNLRPGWCIRPNQEKQAAWLRAGLGRLTGHLVGMIRYRTGPYGRPSPKAAE